MLVGCGKRPDRNVYGNASDDRLISRCTTKDGLKVAWYMNTAGGAAVGTSFSVTTEHEPMLAERQVIYYETAAVQSLNCAANGFELQTPTGSRHFTEQEAEALRGQPTNLDEQH
jgi:hypothetical protein